MTHPLARLHAVLDSLKVRLTFGAVAALTIGMGIVALLLVQETEQDTLASQRNRLRDETVRLAKVLSRRVIDLQRALQVTGIQLDTATLADPQRLENFLLTKPVLNSLFSSVFVAAPDGRILMTLQDGKATRREVDLSNRRYFRETIANGRPVVSEPILSRLSGEAIVAFTLPVRHGGVIEAVLGGTLQLNSRDLVSDLVEDDESKGLLIVADVAGTVLAHPNPENLLGSMTAQPRFAEAFSAWQRGGSAVEPTGLSMPQKGEMVSVSGVPGTDWLVWRAVPERQLLAPLIAARAHALRLVLALLVAMSAVMFLMLSWMLHPLKRLRQRAQHLFDGEQDPQEGWPSARGELAELTRVLRHVAAERAQLESFNDQVLKKLGSVMSSAPIGIAFTRAERFEVVSAELCRLLGRPEHELLGQTMASVYCNAADHLKTLQDMHRAFAQEQPYDGEWQMLGAGGAPFCAQLRGRPVDPANTEAGTIWAFSDITEQAASRTLLEWSATHDLLTGLANRTLLDQRLSDIFRRRPDSLPAALVAIDLDHFKPINDRAGHAAGDAMLTAVAKAINDRVRTSDLVVRTGGDEFALLLEGCPASTALRIANSVRQAIVEIALPWRDGVLHVGASLGVAMLNAEMSSAAAWMEAADAICYEVKRTGRGAVRSTLEDATLPEADAKAR